MKKRKQKGLNLLADSDDDSVELHEMKVCTNGSLKYRFKMEIDIQSEEVIGVKWRILQTLGMLNDSDGKNVNIFHPLICKLRLFSLKGGVELLNNDLMGNVDGQSYLFYSFGEDFDHQVRMEFIVKKHKLGEGGFGSVYLVYDELL